MDSKQGKCPYCGNAGYIKYLYLGLKNKVKNLFRSKTMCNKMLAHWIEKNHWLANGKDCQLKKELWNGKRWSELEWFWSPDSTWTLPTCCVHCDIPIPANHLINSQAKNQDEDSNVKIVACPVCLNNFNTVLERQKAPH